MNLIAVGRVVKAHGIRGEVVVDVLSDVPGRFDAGATVVMAGKPRTIASSRPHQGRLLVRFDGVGDRSVAELLRGFVLEAPAADVSDEDNYYAHELIGMTVVDADGADLGTVSALIELPESAGYDLLEVSRADGTSWLLPAVDDYVEVDDAPDGGERLRVVDPPEGLIEGEPDVVRPDA
ncbi:MAG: ribosome maturation factor RimM [Egicoccus sp.]